MQFLNNTVGRKIVMSVTGLSMIVFVFFHLIGNMTVFSGPEGINVYGELLHSFPPVIWSLRIGMLVMALLHVYFGISLSLENSAAKPEAYAVKTSLKSTFASRNMIWSGLLIGLFICYHLLHFTFQILDPGTTSRSLMDAAGRPDIYQMVVLNFQKALISGFYLAALLALMLHLTHSIQSAFQTVGLGSDRSLPLLIRAGTLSAVVIFLGYAAIPLLVLAGKVR